MKLTEADVEKAAVQWLRELGYEYLPAVEISPGEPGAERSSYGDVILEGRLREALARINPHLPAEALDDVARRVLMPPSPSLEENNLAFHRMLSKGVEVQVRKDGGVRGDLAWLADFEEPENNDWLVVSQLTVVEGDNPARRPDLVVFLNGLPIAVFELKNPQAEEATLLSAWNQLQTYKAQIPSLFNTNELLVLSDGTQALVGSLSAGFSRFGPWRSIDGSGLAPSSMNRLEVLLRGLFDRHRLLDYLRSFIFTETDDGFVKKIAGYHQFYAVNKAVAATVRAASAGGDKRIGVVWHTQGSGKSVSMAFYAGKIIVEPALENPTLVVITDRNDLDDQLFGQFCAARDLLGLPAQAEGREHLRELLQVASGGVVFTTMQKLGLTEEEREKGRAFPTLSERRNVVVIADEAHRTQYEFDRKVHASTGKVSVGLAGNLHDALPNASFIGFTGTPIEKKDKSTRGVFGDEVDTYPMSQAVEDKAVVPIHYEARLAKLALDADELPKVDEEFEEVTEGEEEAARQKLKTRWSQLEAMVGTDKRLGLVARDIVDHWERRKEILRGKAMIVCMSRRICVELYARLIELRPEWRSDKDDEGALKVVMTGAASDPESYQPHIRSKQKRKAIEKRFKDEEDPLELVIVRDMWLTGFDVPCLHTLYLDKPIRGHTLMQAIARVNRVFEDKPHGLVVDYLGLANQLRRAVERYGGGSTDQAGGSVAEEALPVLLEKFGVVKDMFHGFDSSPFFGESSAERLSTITAAANHICGRDVEPLTAEERQRLVTIFAAWKHPRVPDPERAAKLGDGSQGAAAATLSTLEAFLAAEVEACGDRYSRLYDGTTRAIKALLKTPGKMERWEASRQLVLQAEPLVYKLLAFLDPELFERFINQRTGLAAGIVALQKIGASPYTLHLSSQEFAREEGWAARTSLENCVYDVQGARLDTAHASTDTETYLWRCTFALMLALMDHNADRLQDLPAPPAGGPDHKKRFLDAMSALNKAAALALHLEEARHLRDELSFFQAVQRNIAKYTIGEGGKTAAELDAAIRQIVSGAVSSDEVVDIFGAAGIKKPDISILSDDFLQNVKDSPHKNLQVELLKKLLNDEIRSQRKRNVVQAKKFSEMLERTLRAYQNRSIEAAQVILEMIELAKEMRDAPKRGESLGLNDDELAFYDALADHGDVREVMGDETLASIAHELVETIRSSVTIDWTQKEAVRARMRTRIKRLLRKHGYPPDKRKEAIVLVLKQAEARCLDWAA